jgi:hypothetical protein
MAYSSIYYVTHEYEASINADSLKREASLPQPVTPPSMESSVGEDSSVEFLQPPAILYQV